MAAGITTKVEKTIVDSNTGEVLSTQEHRYYKTHEPYFQLFLNDIDLMYKLKTKSEYKLFFCMLYHILYEHAQANIVQITAMLKSDANKIGIKSNSFHNVIKGLMEADIIRRTQRGEYMINPKVFYNGSYKNRKNTIGYYSNLERI